MWAGLRLASTTALGFAFAAACSSFDGDTPPSAISPDAGVLVAASWTLRPSVTCAIARGGEDNLAVVPVDAQTTPRSVPVTIGALEFDGECSP